MGAFTAIIGTLGIGGVLGYCAGLAIKTVGKIVGCLIGLLFILIQVLAYYHIAEWHWEAVQKHSPQIQHGAQHAWSGLWTVLTYNLPFTGGFGVGFWMAMKK
jgi:uncharacterized membrane protein (Fun14 family)